MPSETVCLPLRQQPCPEHRLLHLAHGFGQSEEEGLGNQRMPDVQLADGEDLGDGGNVMYGQSVSGVDDQAQIAGEMRAVLDALELPDLFGVAVCIGVCAGVQLDNGRADITGGLDLPVVGIDKERDSDARVGQDFGKFGNFVLLRQYVQAAFGRDFLPFFRHDAYVFRHHFKRVFEHFFRQRHFKVQARANGVFDGEHVRVFDVAAVFAQVHGNQIRTVRFRDQCRFHRAGIGRAAGIADGGDVIDVDT